MDSSLMIWPPTGDIDLILLDLFCLAITYKFWLFMESKSLWSLFFSLNYFFYEFSILLTKDASSSFVESVPFKPVTSPPLLPLLFLV
jgi:hypothetical protein